MLLVHVSTQTVVGSTAGMRASGAMMVSSLGDFKRRQDGNRKCCGGVKAGWFS
jgi:hypothetical protein